MKRKKSLVVREEELRAVVPSVKIPVNVPIVTPVKSEGGGVQKTHIRNYGGHVTLVNPAVRRGFVAVRPATIPVKVSPIKLPPRESPEPIITGVKDEPSWHTMHTVPDEVDELLSFDNFVDRYSDAGYLWPTRNTEEWDSMVMSSLDEIEDRYMKGELTLAKIEDELKHLLDLAQYEVYKDDTTIDYSQSAQDQGLVFDVVGYISYFSDYGAENFDLTFDNKVVAKEKGPWAIIASMTGSDYQIRLFKEAVTDLLDDNNIAWATTFFVPGEYEKGTFRLAVDKKKAKEAEEIIGKVFVGKPKKFGDDIFIGRIKGTNED